MIMREFPSGGLNEPQMIDHIKFITIGLFHQKKQVISPQTHPYNRSRNSSPSERKSYQQQYDKTQCLERQYNKIKNQATQPKQKRKKMPIFQDIEHLLQTHNKNKQKQFVPITQQISKQVYGKFKQQHAQTQDYIRLNKNKIEQEQKNQELWNDFLSRQSQWLSHKKRMLQQVKLAEVAYRNNLSNSRKSYHIKTSQDSSPKRTQSKYFNEMDETIKKLKDDTIKLRTRVLDLVSRSSSKQSSPYKQQRKSKNFIKTFQYLRK